jgi:hypothetical protein
MILPGGSCALTLARAARDGRRDDPPRWQLRTDARRGAAMMLASGTGRAAR